MKTVEMLAKYLPEWPIRYARIVQSEDCIFYGVLASNELACEAIPGEKLAGLMLSTDFGASVTMDDWIAERMMPKLNSSEFILSQPSGEQLRKENLYHTKCQFLAEVLGNTAQIDKREAERIAEAIDAAFDKITL